jgi:uncharacterized membrane protein
MPDERLQDASKSSGIVILGEDGSVGTGSEIFAENLKRQLDQELTRLSVDAKNKEKATRAALTVLARHEFHSGPIPSAAQFQAYEKTLPGSADRILAMAEREQQHRHSYDLQSMSWEYIYSGAGLIFGFLVAVALVAGAVYLAINDHEVIAGAFLAVSTVGMVARFIHGSTRRAHSSEAPGEAQQRHDAKPQGKAQRRRPST